MKSVEIHANEAAKNHDALLRKPLLGLVYKDFYRKIIAQLIQLPGKTVVEVGSGGTQLKEWLPGCIQTDIFPNPWVDQVENIYQLSFPDTSCSNLILFDVFHHLRYPGKAMNECARVLSKNGRVVIFEPCLSLFGWLVYGVCHAEPIGYSEPIEWAPSGDWNLSDEQYYAAQGNAWRFFLKNEHGNRISEFFNVVAIKRFSGFSYVISGGYSRPQLYPTRWYPVMRSLDRFFDRWPRVFATRMLVVLEKK